MYRIIMVCVAIFSLLLILPIPTHADPIITKDWAFIDNRPADDIFGIIGLRLNLTVTATDSGGVPALTGPGSGATVDSSNSNPPYSPDPRNVPLNAVFPIIGGAEFTTLPPITTSDFPNVTGTYTFTVTNTSSQSDVSISHNLDKFEVIPIPTNLVFSDDLTVFTFTDPDPSPDSDRLRRDYSVDIFDASMVNIFQSDLLGTPIFEVPDGILEPGMLFYFRALSFNFDRDDFSGTEQGHSNVENRAIAYATLQTPVPEPSTILLLGSGLLGLWGFRKKFKK